MSHENQEVSMTLAYGQVHTDRGDLCLILEYIPF